MQPDCGLELSRTGNDAAYFGVCEETEAIETTEVVNTLHFESDSMCIVTPYHLDSDTNFTEEDYMRFDKNADYMSYGFTSVRTCIQEFFPNFDPDVVVANMRKEQNWEIGRYASMSNESIKNLWYANGTSPSSS
jgi:hypothetical protein